MPQVSEVLHQMMIEAETRKRQALLDDLERQRVAREKAAQEAQQKYYEDQTRIQQQNADSLEKDRQDKAYRSRPRSPLSRSHRSSRYNQCTGPSVANRDGILRRPRQPAA